MDGLKTEEAIIDLLYNRTIYENLSDAEKSTFRTYRKRLQDGKLPLDKIHEILSKHGFHVIQETRWIRKQ